MPVYEYRCAECGNTSEMLIRTIQAMSPACSHCGSTDVKRLPSAPQLLHQTNSGGMTCCGREERCEKPPCSGGGACHRG